LAWAALAVGGNVHLLASVDAAGRAGFAVAWLEAPLDLDLAWPMAALAGSILTGLVGFLAWVRVLAEPTGTADAMGAALRRLPAAACITVSLGALLLLALACLALLPVATHLLLRHQSDIRVHDLTVLLVSLPC